MYASLENLALKRAALATNVQLDAAIQLRDLPIDGERRCDPSGKDYAAIT